MSTDIHNAPSTGDLAAYCVGRPVSAEHFLRMCWDVGHLLGFNTQTIIAQRFSYESTTSRTIRVSYTRNPGVDVLMIEVEAHKGSAVGANGTLTVTPSSGSITWLTTRTPFTGESGAFLGHYQDGLRRASYRAYLSVAALTVGTTYELLFEFVNGASHKGVAKITVIEVPLATVDPVRHTAEIGIEAASFAAGEAINSNTTTSSRGMARLLAQADRARTENRRHWQLCTSELDADAFNTTSGSYSSLMAVHSGTNPTWRWRAQRHYTTAEDEVMTLGFRYRVSGGATADLEMVINGATATQITGLTSATYTEATTAFLIPCSGATDQEVVMQVKGRISSGGGTVYVSRVRLLSNQV